jgi:hypothetical protein
MRWIALLSLVALSLAAAGCGGGGQEGDKAKFLGDIRDALDARDAPQSLTNCFVKQVDQRLSDVEVRKAYRTVGNDNASIAEVARAIGPKVIPVMIGGVTACKRQVLQSGEVNRKQVERAFRQLLAP